MTDSGRTYAALSLALLSFTAFATASTAVEFDQLYDYRVSWNGIPAANARIIVTDRGAQPEATTQVRIHMRTNAFVDLFWMLRAETWAEAEAATLQPRRFTFDRRIRGRPEFTEVETGPNGLLIGRYSRPDRYRVIEVNDAGVVDPVTATLQVRRELPTVDMPRTYDIFTGEARYRITLHRRETETIRVPAGRFAAVRIEPTIWRVDRNAREGRVRRITFWVTATAPHTLLRVRSEVFIGAVYCDLAGWAEVERREKDGPSPSVPQSDLEQHPHRDAAPEG